MIKFKTDSETIYNNFVVFFKKSAKKIKIGYHVIASFFFLPIIACITVSFDLSHWLGFTGDNRQKKTGYHVIADFNFFLQIF